MSGCTNGSVRILSASSSNDGVVEVCQDGVWGSIISYSWDSIDARVICKQLGRPWQSKLFNMTSKKYYIFTALFDQF